MSYFVVIKNESTDLSWRKHSQWKPEIVLNTTFANNLRVVFICDVSLLIIRLEDYFEISEDECALQGRDLPQIVFTSYIVDYAILLLANLNFVFLEALDVLLWDKSS